MNNNNDDDDGDNGGRRMSVWLIAPCCCFGLAALIWLIILQVQFSHLDSRLDTLIRNCAGTCPVGGRTDTGGVLLANLHHAVKPAHSALAKAAVVEQKKKRAPAEAAAHAKKRSTEAAEEAVALDARWARVGDAKKPSLQRIQ